MRPYISPKTLEDCKETTYQAADSSWGATRTHNYHLPYGNRRPRSRKRGRRSGQACLGARSKVIVLPVIPFGVNNRAIWCQAWHEHESSTQLAVLRDVVEVLDRFGIHKLIILTATAATISKPWSWTGIEISQCFLCSCNWYQAIDQKEFFENKDDHAGEMETQRDLHLADLVSLPLAAMARPKNSNERHAGRMGLGRTKVEQHHKGYGVGDPRKATAEKGEKYFNAVTEK